MNIEDFKEFVIELDYVPVIKKTCAELTQDIVDRAKQTFKGSGDYANSWAWEMKKETLGEYGIVFNKEHYRLTHLLENGHVVRNGYGETKRADGLRFVAPRPHIRPAFDGIKSQYIKDMEKVGYKVKIKQKG